MKSNPVTLTLDCIGYRSCKVERYTKWNCLKQKNKNCDERMTNFMQVSNLNQRSLTMLERWHFRLKSLKLSISDCIRSSNYSKFTDRGRKVTIFRKWAISPDEGPYRKNWKSQTLLHRPNHYHGNFRWNPSRHLWDKKSSNCTQKRHLAPHLGLRVSPSLETGFAATRLSLSCHTC